MQFEIVKIFKNGLEFLAVKVFVTPHVLQLLTIYQDEDIGKSQGECFGGCFIYYCGFGNVVVLEPSTLAAS